MDSWIEKTVGKMHINKITQVELSQKIGWTREYVSMILNGIKSPAGAEERINKAIDAIISERKS